MEQASGSMMTGIRAAFSAHLPLTPLLLLWPSIIAFRLFVYFQVDTAVSYFLDYVGDIYDDGGHLYHNNVPCVKTIIDPIVVL